MMSSKRDGSPRTAFLSLGNLYATKYESFADGLVEAMSDRGVVLKSVGYNVGTHQQPMRKVIEILDESQGAVIVAFNRVEILDGTEKGEALPTPTRITTPWNHIEAAMAYDRGLPLLVIVEEGVKQEGLLEKGFDWFVLEMPLTAKALQDRKFKLLFEEWLRAVEKGRARAVTQSVDEMTVGDLFRNLKVIHLLGGIVALLATYFAVFEWGVYVGGG